MKYFKYIISFLTGLLLPVMTYAQTNPPKQSSISQIRDANDLIKRLASFGNVAVYLLVAVAVLFIVYSTVRYFVMGDGSEERKAAGLNIFYGLLGLFVIVSLWGIVSILVNTFPTNNQLPNSIPSANFVGNSSSGGSSQPVNQFAAPDEF